MKIWNQYGSEHSMNLVMIGSFKTQREAELTKQLIDELTGLIDDPVVESFGEISRTDRFAEKVSEYLRKENLYSLAPEELEQLRYDVRLDVRGNNIEIKTDEIDVSVFLKLLIDKGAKVEVYSAHAYPPSDENNSSEE